MTRARPIQNSPIGATARCATERNLLPGQRSLHAFGVDIGIGRYKKQVWLVGVAPERRCIGEIRISNLDSGNHNMELLQNLFKSQPLIALFATIALGYLVGKIKLGSFVLGGIAGTLLVGVVIGQFGIDIDGGIKAIFFALFIYAVYRLDGGK